MKEQIRVLIVDDSTVVRTILADMLSVPGFEVVGQARDGDEAVRLTASLRPDVITMDIRMPRLDGLQATRQIMRATPTPIVVVASSVYETDLNIAFNAVEAGALTVVEKPRGLSEEDFNAVRDQLVSTVRLMSDVQVVALWSGDSPAAPLAQPAVVPPDRKPARPQAIAISASTGGPGILHQILSALPADFIPILVVQHITPGFRQGFARWLDNGTAMQVAIAREGERLAPGQVWIAPDDLHLTLTPEGTLHLDHSEAVGGQRPSATRLFQSAAQALGPHALALVLSGMGDDGAQGLQELAAAGGHVLAQDEASCVVFDMPRAAIERGVVDEVLPPGDLIQRLLDLHARTNV